MSDTVDYVDVYNCSGKKYDNEPAIISLTSWRGRIETCSKTIFSLLKTCPGFHIVLVLSEEEFPLKENELPDDLTMLVDNEIIELLWVYKNYRSYKKVLFTMDKYRNVPVISADDGCIYTMNYAKILYDLWLENPNKIISIKKFKGGGEARFPCGGGGYGILFPPFCFKNFGINCIKCFVGRMFENPNDDRFLGVLAGKMKIEWVWYSDIINKTIKPFEDIAAGGLSINKLYKAGTNWYFEKIIDVVLREG